MIALAALMTMLIQVANPVASLLQRAKRDFEFGRYSEARTELKRALNLSPKDAVLWSYLGMTEFKLHESDAAIDDLEKARVLDSGNALNYFNLGMLYHYKGETAKALEAYRHGLDLAPDDRAANESYARLLMETQRYREAIGPLEKSKRNSPANFSLRLALVEAYIKSGLYDQGVNEIQEFVKAPNCSTHDQLDLANLLVENKRAGAARWVFEEVVKTAPDLAEGHAGLGLVWTELNRYEDAARELGRAVQLSPGSADYSVRYVEALLLSRQYPAALDFLKSAKERFGNLPEYRFKLGVAYYEQSEYPAAIDDLDELVRNYPNMDQAHYFLGHSYSATGDLKNAEVQYRVALSLNPRDPSYYAALGHVLSKGSDLRKDEAIKYLERAVQMDPADLHSKEDLAICYEDEGRYPDAERLLEDVTRGEPALVTAHRMLARAYYRQGKRDQGDRESATAAKLEASQLPAARR